MSLLIVLVLLKRAIRVVHKVIFNFVTLTTYAYGKVVTVFSCNFSLSLMTAADFRNWNVVIVITELVSIVIIISW